MTDAALKCTQLDLQHYPLLNFIPESSPTPPDDPQPGQLWRSSVFDTISKYGEDGQWHLIISEAELQQALDDLESQTDADLSALEADFTAHVNDTTGVHGIPDTSLLETQAGATAKIGIHSSTTTNVHGIVDTGELVTEAELEVPIDLTILFLNRLV